MKTNKQNNSSQTKNRSEAKWTTPIHQAPSHWTKLNLGKSFWPFALYR